MKRRTFIAGLESAAVWPLVAHAQQPGKPVVGFLNSGSRDGYSPMAAAFRKGLGETGYVDGRNVAIEYRWADGQYDRVPAMAADLVRRQVAVIVANTPGVLAVRAATTTIPIVFTTASDPVQIGLVAVLVNSTNPNTEALVRDLQAAARALGLQLHVLQASTERDLKGPGERPQGGLDHRQHPFAVEVREGTPLPGQVDQEHADGEPPVARPQGPHRWRQGGRLSRRQALSGAHPARLRSARCLRAYC
jgi:ABC-type uncharacterized transport system substrate-binding protein